MARPEMSGRAVKMYPPGHNILIYRGNERISDYRDPYYPKSRWHAGTGNVLQTSLQMVWHTIMSPAQFLPIPPEMFAHACATVTARVSQLPFLRSGLKVTGELVGVTMECLNAVPVKCRAISTPRGNDEGIEDGLDRCLEERLRISGTAAGPIIAEVLCSAGIAEPALIPDPHTHRQIRGIRLTPAWTWHIASVMAPSIRLGLSGDGDGSSLSWLDLCPVCRTGILERVVGKQLFGIPRTDFYIECSHCGAKFIPVGPAYRLVSIATIRDPLWKKHLDKTKTPQEWSLIARGTPSGGNPVSRPAGKKPAGPPLPSSAIRLTQLKDGSIAVPLQGKTLYFRPVSLHFTGALREDTFARVQKPLEEILEQPGFEHLRSPVNAKYSRYLPLKTGLFLHHLKERHDPFYLEFLNPFGDERYGTFRVAESGETGRTGLLLVVVKMGLYHCINSSDPISITINNRLGSIRPDDCLLSGDPLRCRINTLVCTNKKEAGFYIHPGLHEDERLSVARAIDHLLTVGHR